MFFPVSDDKEHADNLPHGLNRACGFLEQGQCQLPRYDKPGNQDSINDSIANQNIQVGFVSSIGMFNKRKMF
jgi:hypothetical protein